MSAIDHAAVEPDSPLARLPVSPGTAAMVVAVIVLVAVAAITTPAFPTAENVRSVVDAAALTGIAAIGLTFITLSGNFVSLSIEQTGAACSVLLALMLTHGWPVALALVSVLVVAAAIGAVQGGLVGLGANPIIVTLGAGAGLQGLTSVIGNGKLIRIEHGVLGWLGGTGPLDVPVSSYVFILVAALATLYLARRRLGRAIVLTGDNRAAAAASGISVFGVTILVFALSAATAGLVGVLSLSAFEIATVDQFNGLTFDAIAAVLVGGTAITGGEGSPLRTAIGAIFIAVLTNFMILRGWDFGVRLTVEGMLVAISVSAYHLSRRNRRGR